MKTREAISRLGRRNRDARWFWYDETERLEAENARLREALKIAADDLDKAANQFEGIRQAQKAGHEVQVVSNSRVFAAKAQRAREALEAGER